MSREIILRAISSLHNEVFDHFSKKFQGKLHFNCFFKRLKKLFEYTLHDGKNLRSELALNTFRVLAPNATASQIKNAAKVAASVEVLQSFFLIIDDIVDNSLIRRNKPCWHKLSNVGIKACVDGLLLESSVDIIVRNALQDHPRQYSIIDNICETKAKTIIGQELDMATNKISDFNWNLYKDIVEHKTSHYTFYFPLLLGFQLADISTDLALVQSISYKLGYLFQAQDDYLDIFGNFFETGKSSNDFSDSKCTWIICKLLDQISEKKEKIFILKENFGKKESSHLAVLHELVIQEKVDFFFSEFQKDAINEIKNEIKSFPSFEIQELLNDSVSKLTNRKK